MKFHKSEFNHVTQDWAKRHQGLNSVVPVMDLHERVLILEGQLAALAIRHDALLKYPALAEAYNEYKLVEKLILGDIDDKAYNTDI